MKKVLLLAAAILPFLAISCATSRLEPGEELVEFKKLDYEVNVKKTLTKEELRQDCDMLCYILYNTYAGIDEAIENGMDLQATVEEIYNKMLKKKIPGSDSYDATEFANLTRQTISKAMKVDDQHIGIGGSLKDSVRVYYSKVYFEKTVEGENVQFRVKKSEEDKVKEGQIFTGIEANLFETICEDEILYRYGVLTNKKIKSANISVDGETFLISVKDDKQLYQKQAWNGLKETSQTMYMSLSDCYNINGLTDNNELTEDFLEKDLLKIAKAAQNKKNIIFDLRSNTGGYKEFPAKMLAAAYYNKHTESDFRRQIEALMLNEINQNTLYLISPFTMQSRQKVYKDFWKNQFDRLTDDTKKFYKDYWRKMEYKPVRKFIEQQDYYQCNITEFPEPDFQGTVYILINSYTASAAELGTAIAFMLENKGINVKIVGENSSGAVKYVSLWGYNLPNSGIYMYMPSQIGLAPIFDEIPQFMGEGKGFYPDYWTTNENILDTLFYCTGDKELAEVLKGLDKEML